MNSRAVAFVVVDAQTISLHFNFHIAPHAFNSSLDALEFTMSLLHSIQEIALYFKRVYAQLHPIMNYLVLCANGLL
jgi:hypothetical protein